MILSRYHSKDLHCNLSRNALRSDKSPTSLPVKNKNLRIQNFLPKIGLVYELKGDAKKKSTNVLLSTAKDITPRAKLHFKWSKQKVSRIRLRYCTLFYLIHFLKYG